MEIDLDADLKAVRECVEGLDRSRAKSLALTKLDEFEMWLDKAIEAHEQSLREGDGS